MQKSFPSEKQKNRMKGYEFQVLFKRLKKGISVKLALKKDPKKNLSHIRCLQMQ